MPIDIPNAPATYTHRIGFSNGNIRYEPPKKRVYKTFSSSPDELEGSQKTVYKVMKAQVKAISAVDMEKKTPWSRNHCNIILAALTKKGLLTREKKRFNGTNIYFYKIKEEA
jgi:hypothetical protein